MRKILIFSFILLNTIITSGQDHVFFEDYISNFKTTQSDTISEIDFMLGTAKSLSPKYVERFIHSEKNDKYEDEGQWYLYTIKAEEKDFIIAVITKSYEEPLSYEEKLLLIYSKDGNLLDSMSIARERAYWYCNYSGTWKPFNLQIKQVSVVSENLMREPLPYPCKYETYQYTIGPKGKIERKLIEKTEQGIVIWKNERKGVEIVRDSNRHIYNAYAALRERESTFENYISKFGQNKTDTINNVDFGVHDEISGDFIKRFITDKPDCECSNEGLWYRFMSKIEKKDFIIAFAYKSCDIPSSPGYPYSEIILIVYSPKGEIIDSKIISRGGDLWDSDLIGSITPFRLTVTQASIPQRDYEKIKNYPLRCKISTYEYSITEKGKIKQEFISKEQGTIVWDKKKNETVIVKNNNRLNI